MINLGQIIKRLEAIWNNISICHICLAEGTEKVGLYVFRCKKHKDLFFCHQCGQIIDIPFKRICVKCEAHI